MVSEDHGIKFGGKADPSFASRNCKNRGACFGTNSKKRRVDIRDLERMESTMNTATTYSDSIRISAVKHILCGSVKEYMRDKEEDAIAGGRDDL